MKTTKKQYQVATLIKDFTYNFYGENTIPKGRQFRYGGRTGNTMTKDGLVFILGHGADQLIPMEYLKVRTIEEITTTTVTVREL
jgi:hypothetical protein